MNLWTLRSYQPLGGTSVTQDWYGAVGYDIWAVFAWQMDYLCGQPIENWSRPWAAVLKGGKRKGKKGCAGLIEIRFEVGNVQYRPLGFFSGEMEFTFLFFANEVGDEFDPKTACEIAKARKADIEKDRRLSRVLIIAENVDEETSDE
jgi:hypothetical protein